MTTLTASELSAAIDSTVGIVGGKFMIHPETMAMGAEAGYPNGFVFYMRGRGGVLGEVDADVIHSAFMFFNKDIITKMWTGGVATEDARAAGRRFAAACQAFGKKRLSGVAGMDRLAELAEKVISSVDSSGLSLFAGWRAEPLPSDPAARAYQCLHLLRELRGCVHIVAVVHAGLNGLQAVLAGPGGGPDIAKLHGWGEVSMDGIDALRPIRQRAEDETDSMMAKIYDSALTAVERGELAQLVKTAAAAIDATP
jgi:hypothetical protein